MSAASDVTKGTIEALRAGGKEATKEGAKKGAGEVTRQGVREQAMGRKQYRETYGNGNKSWWESYKDNRDAKTREKYEKFGPREEAAQMRREMLGAKLRPAKWLMGTRLGKVALLGAGISMLMNGGLALPMASLGKMIGTLLPFGIAGALVKPLQNMNQTVENSNNKIKSTDSYKNTRASLSKTEEDAVKNTQADYTKDNQKASSKASEIADEQEAGA